MNASQYMDKQIMDLTASSLTQTSPPPPPSPSQPLKQNNISDNDDNIHLMNYQHESNDPHQQQSSSGSLYDMNNIIGDENGIKKEEIVASYDFQPIRPVVSSASLDSSTVARVLNSADSKSNSTSFPLRNYGSLDSIEHAKVIVGNDRNALDAVIVSEIDKTMKKHADNLLHILEGVSARLTQLESRSHHLENSVDELKASVDNNHGNTDGKIGKLENVLIKLQEGVEVLNDKHEIFEAQLKLAGLHLPKADQRQSDIQSSRHMEPVKQTASAPPHSHHQLPPVSFPHSVPPVPVLTPAGSLPAIAQQNFTLPHQFPQIQISSVAQKEPYYLSLSQPQEPSNPQYQITPSQQPQITPSQQPQPSTAYEPAPQLPQLHLSQSSVGHHPVEPPYVSSQSYPQSLRTHSSQPPSGGPPSHQHYGAPSHGFDQSSGRPSSAFTSGYGLPSGPPEPYASSGSSSQFGSNPPMKLPQLFSSALSQSGGSGYPQLPAARTLPHALPTASAVGGGSGSSGAGNRVPIDDVVDKVSTMGFPREHVRATVRKLTENGQSVDLNTVLDKLMNDGEVQPPRGWFGR